MWDRGLSTAQHFDQIIPELFRLYDEVNHLLVRTDASKFKNVSSVEGC